MLLKSYVKCDIQMLPSCGPYSALQWFLAHPPPQGNRARRRKLTSHKIE